MSSAENRWAGSGLKYRPWCSSPGFLFPSSRSRHRPTLLCTISASAYTRTEGPPPACPAPRAQRGRPLGPRLSPAGLPPHARGFEHPLGPRPLITALQTCPRGLLRRRPDYRLVYSELSGCSRLLPIFAHHSVTPGASSNHTPLAACGFWP